MTTITTTPQMRRVMREARLTAEREALESALRMVDAADTLGQARRDVATLLELAKERE